MKTFKNGFAQIGEVANVLAEAAFGMSKAQAELADAAQRATMGDAERFGEALVHAAYQRFGLGVARLVTDTHVAQFAEHAKALREDLMRIADQPEGSPTGPNGPPPRPSQVTTLIDLERVRDLFVSGRGVHNAAYVQALNAVLGEHVAQQSAADGAVPLPSGAKQSDPQERRRDVLKMFRSDEGKRPTEPGAKGKRGALARLARKTGIHTKNLGQMLDKAIQEEADILWVPFARK